MMSKLIIFVFLLDVHRIQATAVSKAVGNVLEITKNIIEVTVVEEHVAKLQAIQAYLHEIIEYFPATDSDDVVAEDIACTLEFFHAVLREVHSSESIAIQLELFIDGIMRLIHTTREYSLQTINTAEYAQVLLHESKISFAIIERDHEWNSGTAIVKAIETVVKRVNKIVKRIRESSNIAGPIENTLEATNLILDTIENSKLPAVSILRLFSFCEELLQVIDKYKHREDAFAQAIMKEARIVPILIIFPTQSFHFAIIQAVELLVKTAIKICDNYDYRSNKIAAFAASASADVVKSTLVSIDQLALSDNNRRKALAWRMRICVRLISIITDRINGTTDLDFADDLLKTVREILETEKSNPGLADIVQMEAVSKLLSLRSNIFRMTWSGDPILCDALDNTVKIITNLLITTSPLASSDGVFRMVNSFNMTICREVAHAISLLVQNEGTATDATVPVLAFLKENVIIARKIMTFQSNPKMQVEITRIEAAADLASTAIPIINSSSGIAGIRIPENFADTLAVAARVNSDLMKSIGTLESPYDQLPIKIQVSYNLIWIIENIIDMNPDLSPTGVIRLFRQAAYDFLRLQKTSWPSDITQVKAAKELIMEIGEIFKKNNRRKDRIIDAVVAIVEGINKILSIIVGPSKSLSLIQFIGKIGSQLVREIKSRDVNIPKMAINCLDVAGKLLSFEASSIELNEAANDLVGVTCEIVDLLNAGDIDADKLIRIKGDLNKLHKEFIDALINPRAINLESVRIFQKNIQKILSTLYNSIQ